VAESEKNCNCVILLGPTACGKTAIGVAIARERNGEIVSADSRQVYKGLDIGSGKDLDEYVSGGIPVPYHLIDITDLKSEYNVFQYQKDFYRVFQDIVGRKKLPVVVGGTGMYLDAVIRNYDLVEVPENEKRRAELEAKPIEELSRLLLSLKPDLHTREDLRDKVRCIRAIEIAEYMKSPEAALMRKSFYRVSADGTIDVPIHHNSGIRDILSLNFIRTDEERWEWSATHDVLHFDRVSQSLLEQFSIRDDETMRVEMNTVDRLSLSDSVSLSATAEVAVTDTWHLTDSFFCGKKYARFRNGHLFHNGSETRKGNVLIAL